MKTLGNPITLLSIILAISPLGACKKDKPGEPTAPPNEEELITTLRLHFHSSGGGEHKHWEFRDIDGDGGSAPVLEIDTLSADSTYAVEIEVLNESVDPAEDITIEILEEGTDHQFFFQPTGVAISTTYDPADVDVNGMPIGVRSSWTVGGAGSGAMTITLRHMPDKNAAGVSNGDITNAGGETDIEVSFSPAVVD